MRTGEPLIILHGLYGSSDNWLNIGEQLSEQFTVYLIDQRNHGKSPHSNTHTYPDMRDDLLEFMDTNSIREANIIGHSMGGKTAIYFALKYAERVKRLIVVDILPTPYKIDDTSAPQIMSHKNILKALQDIDTDKIKTLREADKTLKDAIPYKKVRQFLLKNLKRDENKKFYWLLNINTLVKELPNIMDGLDTDEIPETEKPATLPVLFIKGEKSDYIPEDSRELIKRIFSKAVMTTIKGAGHWVHAEKRNSFIMVVMNFLKN